MSTKIIIISSLMLLQSALGFAGSKTALDGYVETALANNTGVKQQQFQLDRAMQALSEARTLFLPSVTAMGNYTKAGGGRTIDFPIGDLLNPVYGTLNQLTASNKFPQLENASILLNPDNFYDLKVRTAMPLVNAEVYYNKKIKQQAISLQQASVNVYKRSLVKDVKTAYYQYYQSLQAIAIYREALQLVDRNVTMNESLLRNGVRNGTALTRARAEQQKIAAQLTAAENNSRNAKAYFNFLLNRQLDADVVVDTAAVAQYGTNTSSANGVAAREELQQLNISRNMYGLSAQMQRAAAVPKLSTFLDVGSQGFDWAFNDKSRYYFFGVSMEWSLFAWGQAHYKARQADLNVQETNARYDQAESAYKLQLVQAENNYKTAVASYLSAMAQEDLAAKYYNDQLKAYREGALLYIELLDAQNQLTAARLQTAAAIAAVQIAIAETERNTASYPLN